MVARRHLPAGWPVLGAVALALLWPLSAYALSPLVLPGALVVAVAVAIIVRRPDYGLALALALAPWTNMQLGGSQPLRFVLPALAFGLALYGPLISRGHARSGRASWLAGALLIFFAAALVSSLGALDPSASLNKLIVLATATALFFAVQSICTDRRQLYLVVGGAVAGLLLAAAQGVFERVTGSYAQYALVGSGEDVVGRVQGSFGHPNTYGDYLAVLIPLAVAVVMRRSFPPRLRWIAIAALVLGLPAIQFSYSRGAILGVVLGPLIWLALIRPRTAVLVAVVVGIAAVGILPGAVKQRFQVQGGTTSDVTLRSDIWSAAVDIYSDHPVVGVGVNNFSVAYARLPSTPRNATQKRLLHGYNVITPPHAQNLYLNILAEEGMVGIAAFLLLVVVSLGILYRGSRAGDSRTRAICAGLGSGLMALAVQSLLDATLLGEIALPVFALLAVAPGLLALDQAPAPAGPTR